MHPSWSFLATGLASTRQKRRRKGKRMFVARAIFHIIVCSSGGRRQPGVPGRLCTYKRREWKEGKSITWTRPKSLATMTDRCTGSLLLVEPIFETRHPLCEINYRNYDCPLKISASNDSIIAVDWTFLRTPSTHHGTPARRLPSAGGRERKERIRSVKSIVFKRRRTSCYLNLRLLVLQARPIKFQVAYGKLQCDWAEEGPSMEVV